MSASCRVKALCDFLQRDPRSPLNTYTPKGSDIDSIITLSAIFQEAHRDVEVSATHPLLQPLKGMLGLKDYEKVYSAQTREGSFYDKRGIDKEQGCMMIVRPDQYVADVLPLDDYDRLVAFFKDVLIKPAD